MRMQPPRSTAANTCGEGVGNDQARPRAALRAAALKANVLMLDSAYTRLLASAAAFEAKGRKSKG